MWRWSVRPLRSSGIGSLAERVTIDCQKVKPGEPVFRLEKQILRNLNTYTPRQLCICFNGLARSATYTRPALLSIVCELNKALPKLTLKDIAMVVNAFARIGLKNEIFLAEALPRIIRKARDQNNIPALVLLLDGYAKLDLLPNSEFVDLVTEKFKTSADEIKPIDAVTVLRAVSRMGRDIKVANLEDVFPLILESIKNCGNVELKLSGLSNLTRLTGKVSFDSSHHLQCLIKSVEDSIHELSLFHLIQFLNAVTHSDRSNLLVHEILDRIILKLEPQWSRSIKDPESASVLLISACTRCAEYIPLKKIQLILSTVGAFSTRPETWAVLLNLKATINIPLSDAERSRIAEGATHWKLDGHAFSLLLASLVKLEELELVLLLLSSHDCNDRQFLFSLTDQASHTSLLALSCVLVNLLETECLDMQRLVLDWIEKLMHLSHVQQTIARESLNQLQITRAILSSNNSLKSYMHHSIFYPLKNYSTVNDKKIVSVLHKEVLDTMNMIWIESGMQIIVNSTEQNTGYEIDILLN